jgi:hypothetical protein
LTARTPRLSPSLPLDIATLEFVGREVAARVRDWRSAWRMNPLSASAAGMHDPRTVRADELASLERWVVEQIQHADAELDRVATDVGAQVVRA